jgi:hypothetical protein
MPEIFLVECITQHRIVYAVEAESREDASDIVAIESGGFQELGQQWLGETIVSARPVDEATYLEEFDLINGYLESWPTEKKLSLINKEPARESHHRKLP